MIRHTITSIILILLSELIMSCDPKIITSDIYLSNKTLRFNNNFFSANDDYVNMPDTLFNADYYKHAPQAQSTMEKIPSIITKRIIKPSVIKKVKIVGELKIIPNVKSFVIEYDYCGSLNYYLININNGKIVSSSFLSSYETEKGNMYYSHYFTIRLSVNQFALMFYNSRSIDMNNYQIDLEKNNEIAHNLIDNDNNSDVSLELIYRIEKTGKIKSLDQDP